MGIFSISQLKLMKYRNRNDFEKQNQVQESLRLLVILFLLLLISYRSILRRLGKCDTLNRKTTSTTNVWRHIDPQSRIWLHCISYRWIVCSCYQSGISLSPSLADNRDGVIPASDCQSIWSTHEMTSIIIFQRRSPLSIYKKNVQSHHGAFSVVIGGDPSRIIIETSGEKHVAQ